MKITKFNEYTQNIVNEFINMGHSDWHIDDELLCLPEDSGLLYCINLTRESMLVLWVTDEDQLYGNTAQLDNNSYLMSNEDFIRHGNVGDILAWVNYCTVNHIEMKGDAIIKAKILAHRDATLFDDERHYFSC